MLNDGYTKRNYYRFGCISSFALSSLFIVAVSGLAGEIAKADVATLERLVNATVKSGEREKLSISVADVTSGEIVYQLNGTTARVPASVLKTVTSVAALEELGAHYRFRTDFFMASSNKVAVKEKGRSGLEDLYVRGGGDPSLLSSKLWEVAEQLKAQGIEQVGDLVLDDSAFISPRGALGSNPYQAALSATSLDHNCYRLFISPGAAAGQAAHTMLSLGAGFKLVNRVRTVRGEQKELNWSQSDAAVGEPEMTVTASGVIGVNAEPYVEYLTVPTPSRYFGHVFRQLLGSVGIATRGQIRMGITPNNARKILSFASKDLALIIYDLNHYSSNFMAEQIVYALGENDGEFDHKRGVQRLKKLLQRIGVDSSQFQVVDGSGLDRDNRLSTSALVRTLVYAYQKLGIGPDLLASFSRFGATGTLKKRSVGDANASLSTPVGSPLGSLGERSAGVWGKTGSLDGVSSVVGLLEDSQRRRLAYAIISNGFVSKEMEDRMISALLGE